MSIIRPNWLCSWWVFRWCRHVRRCYSSSEALHSSVLPQINYIFNTIFVWVFEVPVSARQCCIFLLWKQYQREWNIHNWTKSLVGIAYMHFVVQRLKANRMTMTSVRNIIRDDCTIHLYYFTFFTSFLDELTQICLKIFKMKKNDM